MSNEAYDWGIDDSMLEKEDRTVQVSEVPNAGIYNVTVNKAYLSKSDGGATAFNLDLLEDVPDNPLGGRTFYAQYWIKSGDEKGNKSTYTDKKGEERPLPGWFPVLHLLKLFGKDFSRLKGKPDKMEVFGKVKDVYAFPELEGLKTKAVVQQYENEYNGEVSIKYDVPDFMGVDGKNHKGEDIEEIWIKKLDKNPIRKIRKKTGNQAAASAPQEDTAKNEELLKKWS